MWVLVIGASAAGQFAALLLARAGHHVLLLDRDDLSPAADVDAAAATAFRVGAPQVVQPHALLPRTRLLLRDHLPDVLAALMSAGAVESPLAINAPPTVTVDSEPGDERFTGLAVRRSTLDWVLRRTVAKEPGIECRFGVRVRGLLADGTTVTGVRTDDGDIDADLVVDASGRRTRIDAWLADRGLPATELVEAECGLAYHSRHYALADGAQLPGPAGARLLQGLDEITVGLWNGDHGKAVLALCPMVEDHRFKALHEPAVFDALARTVPAFRPWLAAFRPTSDVFSMGGLHNTWRRLVVDGRPVAERLVVIGDTRCTTNPTFGRGLPLALLGAIDLVEALSAGTEGLVAELDRRAAAEAEPYFADQARNDAARLAGLRHVVFGMPLPPAREQPDSVSFAELRGAMMVDQQCLRDFWRVMGMLELPATVYTDPDVVRRTRAALEKSAGLPKPPQPTRAELEAALA